MSDESPAEHRTEGQIVEQDVKTVVDHLRAGRTSEREAFDLRDAAIRSLADKAVARATR